MKPLLLIKLGGSVITDKNKPYTSRREHIRAIGEVIKKMKEPLLIAHGSGSFGHTSALLYGGSHGYKSKWGVAKVARDAMKINSIVMDCFIEIGIPAVSFRPMSFFSSRNGELIEQFLLPIETALQQGLIPVVYGDVIWDSVWKSTIFSGETTLSLLASSFIQKGILVKEVIEFCNTNGVLDSEKSTIPEIVPKTWETYKSELFQMNSPDVTGGMRHKIEEGLSLAEKGIPTRIINGLDITQIENTLLKKMSVGTVIHA